MNPKKLNVVLFGQKPIAAIVLSNLLHQIKEGAPLKVAFVCTNKLPKGWWASASLAEVAESHSIRIYDNSSSDYSPIEEHMATLPIDVLVSIQHPHIVPNSIIDRVNGNAFNLHLAPLPRFRGWNGASHAIIEQFSMFGVTLHTMTSDIDFGLIIDRQEFRITDDATAWSLYEESVRTGILVMARFFKRIATSGLSTISGMPMDGESRYYKRDALGSLLDVSGLAFTDLQRIWRATYFPPYPPAYFQTPNGPVQLILKKDSESE